MRSRVGWYSGVLALLGLCAPASADQEKPSCATYGTSVEFVDSPKEAAKWAAQEGRLVLVLHVSGHFEKPEFT